MTPPLRLVSFRLSLDDIMLLDILARRHGISRTEVVRRAVRMFVTWPG